MWITRVGVKWKPLPLAWASTLGKRCTIWMDSKENASPGFYDNLIQKYAEKEVEHVNLKKMLETGKEVWQNPNTVLENARFLQRELPKRLAQRLLDLQFLPYIVVINPNIKQVYEAYYRAFQTILKFPEIKSADENIEFTSLLKRLVDEHSPLVESLAAGLRECKSKPIIGDQLQLDGFLNTMLTSRISRRVLAEQHLALQQRRDKFLGIVCTDLNLKESIEFAGRRAQQVCIETYGMAPPVEISGDKHVSISYVPTHLDYMLFELLKNAMRATIEHTSDVGHNRNIHPVDVEICMGHNTVTLKICDHGGGISGADHDKVWNYGFTTAGDKTEAEEPSIVLDFGGAQSNTQSRMAGLGFGLPLSKLYANYFGGDIELVNLEGYGVDVYLSINLLEDAESIHIR